MTEAGRWVHRGLLLLPHLFFFFFYIEVQLVCFPGGLMVKNPSANAEDTSSVLGLGRSLGKGNGNQSSILA